MLRRPLRADAGIHSQRSVRMIFGGGPWGWPATSTSQFIASSTKPSGPWLRDAGAGCGDVAAIGIGAAGGFATLYLVTASRCT